MGQNSLRECAVIAAKSVAPFLSKMQLSAMVDACWGEEGKYFMQKFIDLAQLIDAMPKTYEQDGMGDQATAYLHYFTSGSDWYITEKDMNGGILQAYGYAILNGDDECAEVGYISIEELTRHGAELDLHFTPCRLAEIKARRAGIEIAKDTKPNLWVVVTKPGQDEEAVWADFPTYREAVATLGDVGEEASVMKRLGDGSLTSEY